MLDLLSSSNKTREEAWEFFTGENLIYVCENTGLDYEAVVRRARELIMRG